MICEEPGCERPQDLKGKCRKHYHRDWVRNAKKKPRTKGHGTTWSYSLGCRCAPCKEAWSAWSKANRAENKERELRAYWDTELARKEREIEARLDREFS